MPEPKKEKKNAQPFALQVGFLTPDNKRRVEFGMLKAQTNDNKPLFVIVFIMSDLQTGGEFQERVKVEVKVGDFLNDKAQAMIDHGLTLTQHQFLRGPITTRANQIATGATGGVKVSDVKLSELHNKLVEMTEVPA